MEKNIWDKSWCWCSVLKIFLRNKICAYLGQMSRINEPPKFRWLFYFSSTPVENTEIVNYFIFRNFTV